MNLSKPIFSVSEFNELINQVLIRTGEVTVEGEIGKLSISQGKWLFITLKDHTATVDVFAAVWNIPNIRSLQEGMLVKVVGRPGLFQKTGKFSLNASQIIPSGEGALKLAYEQLKQQLQNEGLFDIDRKRPLPKFPQKIGLVTAKGSQAYNDFVKVSTARIKSLHIYFYPAQVQGNDSVSSLLKAISFFSTHRLVDVVVVTRGGGSLEDLASFNDERVVRALFACTIPTVCAIGHEGDVALAELAADLRASTPSNAAELIVPNYNDVLKDIAMQIKHLESKVNLLIAEYKQQLWHSTQTLERHIFQQVTRASELNSRLQHQLDRYRELLALKKQQLEHLTGELITYLAIKIKLISQEINQYQSLLHSWNPRAILAKGYTLTYTQDKQLIKSATTTYQGQQIITQFHDGKIQLQVTTKNYEKL